MEAKTTDKLFLVGDFCISLTAVSLFGSASVGHFREKLWENGGVNGWNSNPNYRVYYYANHEEPPEVPLIWSPRLTDANLAVSLLSMVILLARVMMMYFGQMSPTFSMMYDALLGLLWIHSISSQASGDFTDPRHPSPHPWYLTRHCQNSAETACRVAQASFVVSVLAALFYSGRLIATAVASVRAYRTSRKNGYQLVSVNLKSAEEEDGPSLEDEMAKERERYLYREALSPVLAFFPEDAR
ncbi:uncharacterized protein CTRU02_208258 [Colletotrichum truncatum]|uniref:Uncharacterized protein n=1 Tax=Colletotrichum truncatum TaxID=5467 RepID=A0ACC3YVT0_COLTU|nr:uncharacterized protein CTRU02_07563 [Colletotrichum truncatum]KAF6791223.1 hypothetical protein CTRU02_07563 [Colletotrichum truncatum]